MIPVSPNFSSARSGGKDKVLPRRTGRLFFLLTILLCSAGLAVQRQPGRDTPEKPARLQIQALLQFPSEGGQAVPGLFELLPSGLPDKPVWPALLYQPSGQARTGAADYFSKRLDVPVSGTFQVAGILIRVPSGSALTAVSFPEISLSPEAPGGGPDLSRRILIINDISAEPGEASLLVDLTARQLILSGPARLYVTLRFPPGDEPGGRIMLDTDNDRGLYPRTNYLSTEGGRFITFEEASTAVRASFYGLEALGPPGTGADNLALGLYAYTDTALVAVRPPEVKKIELGPDKSLRVQLTYPSLYADGRPFTPPADRKIRAYLHSPETSSDSLLGDYHPDSQDWIEIAGLGPALLRFAALEGSGRGGLAGGAYLVSPFDANESNDSPQDATPAAWGGKPEGELNDLLSVQGTIGSALDFDFFRISLTKGDSLIAGFAGPGAWYSPLDPVLSLLDSTGLVLEHIEGAGANVSAAADYSGPYYLLVNDRALLSGGQFSDGYRKVYRLELKNARRRGDVDGNGVLDYRDAFLVFLLSSGLQDTLAVTPGRRQAADFNGNGVVQGDLNDFILLLRAISYIPSRDSENPDKSSDQSEQEYLASAGSPGWRLACPDGSALRLAPGRSPEIEIWGEEAAALLELAGFRTVPSQDRPGMPQYAVLERNVPNPFNPSTGISFSLAAPGRASLEVFDTRGRKVRTLVESSLSAGRHTVYWDGSTAEGGRLASGVYFYRLRFADTVITRKMILIK